MRFGFLRLLAALSSVQTALAVGGKPGPPLDVNDRDSIIEFSKFMQWKMITRYYHGNESGRIPGLFDDSDIYWWQAGAWFGSLIDYWFLTNDDSNNAMITQALIHQAAPTLDFEPVNQTRALGNDDVAFWAIAAMSAAEKKFPELPKGKGPGWLALVERVWQRQVNRWEVEYCGGGIRWQIPLVNTGYDYKNVVSNGLLFQMSARLARYTGNSTYKFWADKTFDWLEEVGHLNTTGGNVYDGGTIPTCNGENLRKPEWTYNSGIILLGAAFMWNISEPDSADQQKWQKRIDLYLGRSLEFHIGGNPVYTRNPIKNLIYEPPCEYSQNPDCDNDQTTFKGYWARFLSLATQLAPFMLDRVLPVLKTSADYAARTCVGGAPGDECGMLWFYEGGGKWDGRTSIGAEMSVFETAMSLLVNMRLPLDKEGTSEDFKYITKNGGSRSIKEDTPPQQPKKNDPTGGDKAGAWILTLLLSAGPVVVGWWAVGAPKFGLPIGK